MRRAWLACAAAAVLGCGSQSDTLGRFGGEQGTPIPKRAASVLVPACQLDAWQSETIASSAAKSVLGTVILLCPTMRDDGTIAPAESSAQHELAQQVSQLRTLGYAVRLAVTMADELGQPYPAQTMQSSLGSATWRAQIVANAAPFAAMADGLDLQLPPPPAGEPQDVTSLTAALAHGIGGKHLGIFAPPSLKPGDVPGADAYDLASLGPLVDRVHLLTLDYSCCNGAGPTIDPGWAVDVERTARGSTSAPVDVSYPLYGWDFGPNGASRSVSYLEAEQVAGDTHATVRRGPTGEPFYDWTDTAGGSHETWFDDATSTSWALAAWDTQTLPGDVGVVFWGLGSEDPQLWTTLAGEVMR
ncbi:MAG TPA: hypothetical protein VF765_11250 [Polyangiaceae bacterium]